VNSTELAHLRRCLELAGEARERGDRPFGSLLVGGDGVVLAEDSNREVTTHDCTAHPELALARWAFQHLDADERAAATMYTSCEHCPMCAGGHYWAGIGRLVFALSGEQLAAIAPDDEPGLALGTRDVFARGNLDIVVEGPSAELSAEAHAVFDGYFDR
jgi:tRNA(Arg) A34 adenosine deaminase TadA